MSKNPELLEKEAYAFLFQENFEEAFKLFRRAAESYKGQKNYKQATLCFTSAASCWNKKYEEKTFFNAASSYEKAAREAEKYGDLEYATLLYKYAAINYERDVEFFNFSDCFYRSKECYRKFLMYSLINPKKIRPIAKTAEAKGIKGVVKRIFLCFISSFSFVIWGHGERPARTLVSAAFIIFLSAFLYTLSYLVKDGILFKPEYFEAFYFSVVTFTTLGYGDITPIGCSKLIATIEAFSGLFIMSLFVIGLSRKYLRI